MIKYVMRRLPYDVALWIELRVLNRTRNRGDALLWTLTRALPATIKYRVVILAFAHAYRNTPVPHDVFRDVCEAALGDKE